MAMQCSSVPCNRKLFIYRVTAYAQMPSRHALRYAIHESLISFFQRKKTIFLLAADDAAAAFTFVVVVAVVCLQYNFSPAAVSFCLLLLLVMYIPPYFISDFSFFSFSKNYINFLWCCSHLIISVWNIAFLSSFRLALCTFPSLLSTCSTTRTVARSMKLGSLYLFMHE